MTITSKQLRELLTYDPDTGVFTRRVDVKGGATKGFTNAKAGSVAGGINNLGYVRISVDGKRYLAHRLAFLYMTGEWPSNEVDHRDGNPSNNAWANLRAASHAENMRNGKARKHNSLGIKGVRRTATGAYSARITINRETLYLGTYTTPDEAAAIYALAAKDVHGSYGRPA